VQKLDGKRALVTGGASGIGHAIARLFLENGARTVISDIDGDRLASAQKELAECGTVRAVGGDVRSMADAARMVQAAVDEFGGLDTVVCNAGITSVKPIENLDEGAKGDHLGDVALELVADVVGVHHALPGILLGLLQAE